MWTPHHGPQSPYSPSHCPAIPSPWPGALSSDSTQRQPLPVSPLRRGWRLQLGMSSIPVSDTSRPACACLSCLPRGLAGPQVCTPKSTGAARTPELLKARTTSLFWLCRPGGPALSRRSCGPERRTHSAPRSAALRRPTPPRDYHLHFWRPDGPFLCFWQKDPAALSQPGCCTPVAPPSGLLTRGGQGPRESWRWARWGSHWRGALGFWGP